MLFFEILDDIGCTACRVRAHRIESGAGISAKYGFGHDLVLSHGSLQPVARIEKFLRSERLEPLPQICSKGMQVAISRTDVNSLMETFVEIGVTIGIAIQDSLSGPAMDKFDLLLFRHPCAKST